MVQEGQLEEQEETVLLTHVQNGQRPNFSGSKFVFGIFPFVFLHASPTSFCLLLGCLLFLAPYCGIFSRPADVPLINFHKTPSFSFQSL